MAKKAIVTGGSRGIGAAIVETLAAQGCEVADLVVFLVSEKRATSRARFLPLTADLPHNCE